MKNAIYLLLSIGLIFASCESSDDVGITEYVMASETQYIHGSSGIDSVTSHFTYDQEKLVKIEVYTPDDDRPSDTYDFFYDENDQLSNSHVVSYTRIDRVKFQETFYSYTYNAEEKIASQIRDSLIQHFGGPITVTNPYQVDYQYDSQQRLVSIHTHDESEASLRRFFYDNQSNLIKEEYYRDADDTDPAGIAEFISFDNHPNPFYAFMQKVNIPYYELGYRYSAHNVLEAMQTLGGTTTTYEYEYSTTHDFPIKIYRNDKLMHELIYERSN